MKQRAHSLVCRSLWLGITGICCLGGAAPAAEPVAPGASSTVATNTLTLVGAIRLALENNPELRASLGRVDAAAGRAHQAKLWSNPELSLNAEDWPANGRGGYSDSKQTVGLAQTIPFPGKKKLDRQLGVSDLRFSEVALSLRRVELVRDVKIAFYQVLAAERLVEVAAELVRVAESSAATAKKRVAAGAASDQEQLRAEIPMEQARTGLSGFQHDLVAARQTLALLLGQPALSEVPLTGALAETVTSALLGQRPEQWLDRHPNVVAVKTSRKRAELELRRARLEPYPDVRVGVSGGRVGETDQSIIQLGFSVPLPIIDRSKGKKQEAQANVRIAEADQVAIEQRLVRAWATANQRYRTAIEQVASYRERILPTAAEALRLVQTGFEQGKFGFIDLLDTQRTAAEVQLTYQHKLLELNVAQAELEALLVRNSAEPRSVEPPPAQPNP